MRDELEISALLSRHYGLDGRITHLAGERDQNLLLETASGERMVVKLIICEESVDEIECQTAVLEHLAATEIAGLVPRIVGTRSGDPFVLLDNAILRVLAYLDGVPLAKISPHSVNHRAIGFSLGRLVHALRDFEHPGAHRTLLWDIMQWEAIATLADQIDDSEWRGAARQLIDRFVEAVAIQGDSLWRQTLHNDFNPHNLLTSSKGDISGIIDFGDMVHTARAVDLAVAMSYHFSGADPLQPIAAILAGYTDVISLYEAEEQLLAPAIGMRAAATLAITEWRARRHPERSAYLRRNVPASQTAARYLLSHSPERVADELTRLAHQQRLERA